MALLSFLDREHTIAKPGFSRWLVPTGSAFHPSGDRSGLRLQRVQDSTQPVDRHLQARSRRLEAIADRVDFLPRHPDPRPVGRPLRQMARRRWPAQSHVRFRRLLQSWFLHLLLRRTHAPALDYFSRLRRRRRHRPRLGIHFARLHAHQVVPRPPRPGHRHGHHGIRWRRHDRLPSGRKPDGALPHLNRPRRRQDLPGDGHAVFPLHDVRRVHHSRAAAKAGVPRAGRSPSANPPWSPPAKWM